MACWQLGDAKFVTKAVEGIDAILHVAAIPNIWSGGAEEIMQTNVAALYHLFDAAEAAGDIYGVKGIDNIAKDRLISRILAGSYPRGPSSKPMPEIWKMVVEDLIEA